MLMLIGLAVFGLRDSLDGRYFYTFEQARELWRALDGDSRKAYLLTETVDLVFIALYTSAFYRILRPHGLAWLALAPGACDLVETVGVLCALTQPEFPEALGRLGYVTAAKWTLAVPALLAGLWAIKKGRGTPGLVSTKLKKQKN